MATAYRDALQFLHDTGSRGIKVGLERTRALLEALEHPEQDLRGVLVAGTNGKGSTCAMVDSICRAAGLRTTLLTKPHLTTYRERFMLDGRQISTEQFAALMDRIRPAARAVEQQHGAPTQFEVLTALGVLAAAEHRPDVTICEVGLGGRLDSTNVLNLGIATITNIALDHREYLGDTIASIAGEKAGILKPGNAVVTGTGGEALEVVRQQAAAVGAAPLLSLGNEIRRTLLAPGAGGAAVRVSVGDVAVEADLPLHGDFQADNAALAVAVCGQLPRLGIATIPAEAMRQGLSTVSWPGRLQWLRGEPTFLLDSAHNPAAVTAIVPTVRELVGQRPLVALVGVMGDKDLGGMIEALRPLNPTPVFTHVGSPRSATAMQLASLWGRGARAISELPDALTAARMLAGRQGVVLVCGSIYLVGEILPLLDSEARH